MKKKPEFGHYINNVWTKTVRVMKLTSVLIFLAIFSATAEGFSQGSISLNIEDASLKEVFQILKSNSEYTFVYSEDVIESVELESFSFKDASFGDILSAILAKTNLDYYLEDNVVVIRKKNPVIEQPIQQEKKLLKGKVTDSNNIPLPGVSVVVKGTNFGVATDVDGNYSLELKSDNAILIFSFVGMRNQEVKFTGQDFLNVILEEDQSRLGEIVITGYQTISRERVTGSYDKITEDEISKRVASNLSEVFSGSTTGVEQKADGKLIIRGVGTFSDEKSPLIVVDGFPIDGDFSTINPNDVASIDILKDASATSIYGARAANGVIVVTTKQSKKGSKLNVEYNSFMKIGDKPDLDYGLNIANSKAQVEFDERYYNLFEPGFSSQERVYNSTGKRRFLISESMENIVEYKQGNITKAEYEAQKQELISRDYKKDYKKYLLRNLVVQQHNFVVSNTTASNAVKLSVLYENDKTSFKYNNNNKVLLNLNNKFIFSDKLNFNMNINANFVSGENSGQSLKALKAVTSAYTRLVDENGNYTNMPAPGGIYRPYMKQLSGSMPYEDMKYNALQEAREREITNNKFDLRIQNALNYKISDELKLSALYQHERSSVKNQQLYSEKTFFTRNYINIFSKYNAVNQKYDAQLPMGAIVKDQTSLYLSHHGKLQLDFNKTFNEKHNIVVLAGGEVLLQKRTDFKDGFRFGYNERSKAASTFNYAPASGTYKYFDTGYTFWGSYYSYEDEFKYSYNYKDSKIFSDRTYEDRYVSGFLNTAYTYDSKYTLSLSVRADASNFVADNVRDKVSPFWSVGVNWNVKSEDFMSNIDQLDRLIVRASWGKSGLAAGKKDNSSLTTVSTESPSSYTNYEPVNGIMTRGNPSLTWEKTKAINIGVDFSLMKGLLSGTVDYYKNDTYDVLSKVDASYLSQSSNSITLNNGKILNTGIEFALSSRIKISKDIKWNGTLRYSYNKNEVKAYDYNAIFLSNYVNEEKETYVVGRPVDGVYAIRLSGYSPEGFIKILKKDGTEQIVDSNEDNPIHFSNPPLKEGETPDDNEFLFYQGQLTPSSLVNFSTDFAYKNFELRMVFSGKFGHIFRRNDDFVVRNINALNYSKSLDDGWDKGDALDVFRGKPIPNSETAPILRENWVYSWYNNLMKNSSHMTEDASHIRFDEIYLGYKLPNLNDSKLTVNIFTQVKNVGLVWTANKKGIDPEYIPGDAFRPVRTYALGVKLNF